MRNILIGLASLVAFGTAAPSAAVTNFSSDFDSVAVPASGYTTVTQIEGWTAGPLGVEVQSNGIAGTPGSGANLIELDTSADSWMSRSIDAGNYSLSFAYSTRPGVPASSSGISIFMDDQRLFTLFADGTGQTDTDWRQVGIGFTAATAGTLRFAATGTSDGVGGYLDSIRLSGTPLAGAPMAPVPEPGEWAMLAAGLGIAGFTARRRRAR